MTAPKNQGTALVTGASSGIGAIYADRLARHGYDLILVARKRERLEALAQRLTCETGRQVDVVVADLNDRDDVGRVEDMLRTNPRLTLLVNNAGVGSTAPLLNADIDTIEDMIAVNVTALTRLTYAAAPAFVARGRGTLVNIASIVAVAPEILNGVYGGTKAFVLALSRSLRHELADKGVRVQVVLPGAIATEFWTIASDWRNCSAMLPCWSPHVPCGWAFERTRPRPNRNISDDSTGEPHDPIRSDPTKPRAGR